MRRQIELDDDVWAECQRLGKEHGTINEGLRAKLIGDGLTIQWPSRDNAPDRPFKPLLLKPNERGKQ